MNKKNVLEDMVRVKRERIKMEEPKVVHVSRPENKIKHEENEFREEFINQSEKIPPKNTRTSSSKNRLLFVAFLCLIGLFFAVSILFWKATIIVHPKIGEFTLNTKLLAAKDPSISNLPFELVVISGVEEGRVKTGEEQEYNDVAEGVAVLYNLYSTIPQKIAVDTRLEGSNGKIYKTREATTIPPITFDGFPGAVEVTIYANEAGEEYNSPPLDFKILGFKGTPKYESFYGRSKTAIQGGLKGRLRTVSEVNKAATFSSLETTLKAKLFKKISDQIPEGFVLFPGAVSFRVEEEKVIPSVGEESEVSVSGTLSGMLFKEDDLTKKIAEMLLPEYDGSELYVENINNLKFTFSAAENLFWDSDKASFTLSGNVKLIWKVAGESIIPEVIGKKKSDMEKVLLEHPNIESLDLSIRPFWKKTLPIESKNIEVRVLYPQ